MKKFFTLSFLISLLFTTGAFAQQQDIDETLFNCYTIIAGKNATTDGSVIVGHNEDDWNEQMLNMYIVPRRSYEVGEMLRIEGNAPVAQPQSTAKYFWIEMLAQHYADVYMNEHGVAVVSNRCTSREDRKDYTDGGLSYTLRRIVAERAKTAREAVSIIGEMVEKYGYSSTGRSYSVADKKEGWIVAIVQGRHWVAQRIDDDKVMVIPNYYTIDKIDLNDTKRFAGSKDIITYAIERGWYNPETDGEFSFRKAYSDIPTLNSSNNKGRKWGGLRLLAAEKYNINDEFPFQFVPKQKVDIKAVMNVLSDHFEGSDLDRVKASHPGEPHSEKGTICNRGTQSSTVFHLTNYPPAVGAVMWTAMYSPCRQIYLPWYAGTDFIPSLYGGESDAIEALNNHYKIKKGFREAFPNALYWKFLDYSKHIGQNYVEKMEIYAPMLNKLQDKIFKAQQKFDESIKEEYKFMKLRNITDSDAKISKKLGEFTRHYHGKMMKIVNTRK